ncbi:uncharacterized protein LOC118749349 [Rhagoletis pomonella]|uniref:uncharacterized protein LOC118749349 n=1 Tax=Rhagoletis pomonella TaxID=28610 RepID=UPI0017801C04|nr:uncharacterized protein LOC118749349 [Rhagoletis pomonella]
MLLYCCGIDNLSPATLIGQHFTKKLAAEIKQKFSNIELVKLYSIATLLDPRYKKLGCQSICNSSRAVVIAGEILKTEIQLSKSTMECIGQQTPDKQPSSSRQHFWDFLDKEVQLSQYHESDEPGRLPIELREFLNRPAVDRGSNPNPMVIWKSIEN